MKIKVGYEFSYINVLYHMQGEKWHSHEWQVAGWGAQLQDQKQAILGHTAAMDRVTDFNGATGPTISWDHDTRSMCCVTCRVKNGTAVFGIGYRRFLVVTGWAISLLCTNSSVYWDVVLQISLPVWLYLSCHSHLQCLFQYLLAICKYRGRRARRFGHMQLH